MTKKLFLFSLATLTVLIPASLGDQTDPRCEYANVKVTTPDGSSQVFTVKHLQPVSSDGESCESDGCNGWQYTEDSTHVYGGSNSRSLSVGSSNFKSSELAPTVTYLMGEILAGCDSGISGAEIPTEFCQDFQQLAISYSSKQYELKNNKENLHKYASIIVSHNLLPIPTGIGHYDHDIAYGLVLILVGLHAEAIDQFSDAIKINSGFVAGYHGRGMAFSRLGLHDPLFAEKALLDFTKAINLEPERSDSYERRSEILLPLGRHEEALLDINKAIKLKATARTYFLRGTINFANDDLLAAEKDFQKSLKIDDDSHASHTLYNLGLTQYYRGKIRNAIEVFREAIKMKPDYAEAHSSLGHAYRELGDYKKSLNSFNKSLSLQANHILSLQLRGSLYYYSGKLTLAREEFKKCLVLEPLNKVCMYMQGLSSVATGRFYEGVKFQSKVIAYNRQPVLKISSEFVKAHYLKEYARYIHGKLDSTFSEFDLENDFDGAFRDHWAKQLPLPMSEPFLEQQGIQPHIIDVVSPFSGTDLDSLQLLICKAKKLGSLTQASSDGYLPNERLNFAMGLASIHIAQMMEQVFRDAKQINKSSKPHWKEIFDIAILYRRLVDPEQAVLWLDQMPEEYLTEGYNSDIYFIRGHTINIKLMQYFDLVFKLVQKMIEYYDGDSSIHSSKVKEDLDKANTYEDLIDIARRKRLNQQGFMLSTQVPSAKDAEETRHEGVILTLTGDVSGQVIFAINVATTKSRTASYYAELDYLFNEIIGEVANAGTSKMDVDSIVHLILSFVYYFYNLMPLSRGSSVVAYTVAMGLFMAVGREITGKIPQGKLVEMEAMLSGAPDAFVMVTKGWMNIKKMSSPVSSYPNIAETLPTIRHILEVLNSSPNC